MPSAHKNSFLLPVHHKHDPIASIEEWTQCEQAAFFKLSANRNKVALDVVKGEDFTIWVIRHLFSPTPGPEARLW